MSGHVVFMGWFSDMFSHLKRYRKICEWEQLYGEFSCVNVHWYTSLFLQKVWLDTVLDLGEMDTLRSIRVHDSAGPGVASSVFVFIKHMFWVFGPYCFSVSVSLIWFPVSKIWLNSPSNTVICFHVPVGTQHWHRAFLYNNLQTKSQPSKMEHEVPSHLKAPTGI